MTPSQEPSDLILWPDPKRGPWALLLHWAVVDGRVECVGLTITSDPEKAPAAIALMGKKPRPLATSDLRLPLASIVQEQRGLRAAWLRTKFLEDPMVKESTKGEIAARIERIEAGGVRSRTPDFLLRVAQVYAAADEIGQRPTRAVAEHSEQDWPGPVSRSTAANWVAAARQAGYLTKGTRRRAGGRLTAKARKALEKGEPS